MATAFRASSWLRPAALLGVAAPLLILFAAVGAGVGWLSFDTAFGLLTMKVAFWLAVVATLVGLIATVLSRRELARMWPWAAAALVVPALTLGGHLWMQARADALPPVHETASDWSRPLGFSRDLTALRGSDAWPVTADPSIDDDLAASRAAWSAYAGRRVADVNAEACPEARTVARLAEPEEVIAALEAENVRVIGTSPWRVEGYQESAFFGRARDVAVRMAPGATDIRVSERIGGFDMGETCGLAARVLARLEP